MAILYVDKELDKSDSIRPEVARQLRVGDIYFPKIAQARVNMSRLHIPQVLDSQGRANRPFDLNLKVGLSKS